MLMKLKVLADADTVARQAAAIIAAEARTAAAARGRFLMAVSGGPTPWLMLRALASEVVPWESVHLVQVDERVAPVGHPFSSRPPRFTMSLAGARSTGLGDEFRLYDLTVSAGGPTRAQRPLLRVTPPTFDPS